MANRGQAFETMMLVISVIVALAILGVLLQILGIVKIFNPSDPAATMSQDLKKVQTKGYGIEVPRKLTLSKSIIDVKGVITDIPILEDDVKFVCDDDAICGSDKAISLEKDDKRVVIKNNVEVFVAVCGDASNDNGAKYCVAFSRTETGATESCDKGCLGG
ncbi:hypothetical protein HY989_00340 [Candidatus Micrarchaeota archaeon]|nr:hypothetical protein [Candidatus Micrarchaeota archaeon]